MQTASNDDGSDQARPLTHAMYIAAATRRAQHSKSAARLWVQVQRRYREAPRVLCGQVRELSATNGDWFKVDTDDGALWAESRNVRLCSGDGRCTCDQDEAQGATKC